MDGRVGPSDQVDGRVQALLVDSPPHGPCSGPSSRFSIVRQISSCDVKRLALPTSIAGRPTTPVLSRTEEVTWGRGRSPVEAQVSCPKPSVSGQPSLPRHEPPSRRPELMSVINVAQPDVPPGSATPAAPNARSAMLASAPPTRAGRWTGPQAALPCSDTTRPRDDPSANSPARRRS